MASILSTTAVAFGVLVSLANCSGPAMNADGGADAPSELDSGPADRQDSSETDSAQGTVVSVPLAGCSEASYSARVTFGNAQSFSLLIDTGSTTLAVAASDCSTCGVSPVYTPDSTATDLHQEISAEYGSSSADLTGWKGDLYKDIVGTGEGAAGSTFMRFVAIRSQSQFFEAEACGTAPFTYEGVLGLAPLASAVGATDGYVDDLVAKGSVQNVFATELCEPGGHLWLGGYDPAFTTAPPQYTPFSTSSLSEYYYVVHLESIVVAGITVPIPTSQYTDTLLDTGNNTSFLSPAAFTAVTDAIMASSGFQAAFGAQYADPDSGFAFFSEAGNCSDTTKTKDELDATLPPLTLVFQGTPNISVNAVATEAYLVPSAEAGRPGRYCPGIFPQAPTSDFPLAADLGSPTLRSNVVIFDRAKHRVGFAPHTACP
jgi:hypothetical protein